MDVHVPLGARGDLATQLYRQVLDALLDGRLHPGERLPATRELARRLSVSRNSAAVAYERLTAEGFLSARVGAGTFVSDAPVTRARTRAAPGGGVRPRAVWQSLPDRHRTASATPAYDFRAGMPDGERFPLETWRRLIAREYRRAVIHPAAYGDPAGLAGLRAAIARHVGVSRSVRAGADDVIVTHGAQQALDLIGRVLSEPGCRVAGEEPGYPPARLLCRSLGARVTGVPVDSEGIDVTALPRDARVVYVTPSHQYPLGTPMSLRRRTALLAWAERNDAVVIEDDYDSEFRFQDRPLEPLQSLDRLGRVIYVGSFSKTLLPMLRLGFLVAPTSLRTALRTAKRLTDWHGELPPQAALAHFIDDGMLARHIRRATREYGARRRLIIDTLRRDFTGLLDPAPSAAGLHICARIAHGTPADADRTVERARPSGVAVESLTGHYADGPGEAGLLLGYGAIPLGQISAGLRLLAASLRE